VSQNPPEAAFFEDYKPCKRFSFEAGRCDDDPSLRELILSPLLRDAGSLAGTSSKSLTLSYHGIIYNYKTAAVLP
jgi:hypothetical protein